MNWAAVAKSEPVKAAPVDDGGAPKPRVAVVDANAIITQHGLLNLIRFADKCVTTPEVLREVRDKQSRQALAALPFTIETQEPADDSVKAGGCCRSLVWYGVIRWALGTHVGTTGSCSGQAQHPAMTPTVPFAAHNLRPQPSLPPLLYLNLQSSALLAPPATSTRCPPRMCA
jgi:hypothetical protein